MDRGRRVFTEPAPPSHCLTVSSVIQDIETRFVLIFTEKETEARRDCVETVTQAETEPGETSRNEAGERVEGPLGHSDSSC